MATARENLSSQLDGATKTFTVLQPYLVNSLSVIVNGLYLTPGVDFTTSVSAFSLTGNVEAPASGETMVVTYEVQPAASGTSGGGGSPGTSRVIGLPSGAQVVIYY